MAAAVMPTVARRWARAPFYFNSAAHLIRIGREKASNLTELLEGLKVCPDASIFQHTFQTLQEHHFLREGFSNDFAHWAFHVHAQPPSRRPLGPSHHRNTQAFLAAGVADMPDLSGTWF